MENLLSDLHADCLLLAVCYLRRLPLEAAMAAGARKPETASAVATPEDNLRRLESQRTSRPGLACTASAES